MVMGMRCDGDGDGMRCDGDGDGMRCDGDGDAMAWRRWRRQSRVVSDGRCASAQLQNGAGVGGAGGVAGGEEYSVAGFLARLGLALDGAALRLDKERADEPKEEDDGRKSAESQGKPEEDERVATPGSAHAKGSLAGLYHGTWPLERALWHSGPPTCNQELASVMSFSSGAGPLSGEGDLPPPPSLSPSPGDAGARRAAGQQQLGAKVEMVYGLLSMLGAHDREDMSRTLLAMSASPDACLAMRKSGCLPLLVQLLHGGEQSPETRRRAAQALHNVVHAAASAAAAAAAGGAERPAGSGAGPGAGGGARARGRRPPAGPSKPHRTTSARGPASPRAQLLAAGRSTANKLGASRACLGAPAPAPAPPPRARRSAPARRPPPSDDAAADGDEEQQEEEEAAEGEERGANGCDESDDPGPGAEEQQQQHPVPTVAALMKLSFDEEHRHAMCELGGLHAIAELLQMDHEAHGSTSSDQNCIILRRYAGMALTNLTFGDSNNKALLCSFQQFMRALVAQLSSPNEDLRQVTASVLRNLSWKADSASKQTLREVGAVPALVHAAMEAKKESTLKSILSALWNLSAHCSINKVDICAVEGALGFFVDMLSYQAPSKSLAIIENAGGILRNVSSHIAMREDYRAILREHKCLQVLLQQLKSPSLTIVSNACGTLWNLSAQCAEDQRTLWEMGAVSMLRSLIRSKHKMISMGSSAALKNLLSARPDNSFPPPPDPVTARMGLTPLPGLHARRQRALEQELDQSLAETCDNIEPSTSPNQSFTERQYHSAERRHSRLFHKSTYQRGPVARSDSRDSVTSTHSDSVYERVSRNVVNVYTYGQASPSSEIPPILSTSDTSGISALHSSLTESGRLHSHIVNENLSSERRFLRRYVNSMKEREERKKVLPLNISCEDNERQSSSDHETFQRSRLGQIEEAVCPERRDVVPDDAPRDTSPDASRPETKVPEETVEADEIRLSSNVQLDVMSLTPASPAKQNKNLLYDNPCPVNQRSAFSPLVGSPFSGSSSRTQYQQGQNSSAYTRNKYSDLGFEETESQEQPVDYSLKYVEHPVNTHNDVEGAKAPLQSERTSGSEPAFSNVPRSKQNQNDLGQGYTYKNQVPNSVGVTNKNMKMNVVYGDYAETDLDQPTDYSLKYPEEEEEEEDGYQKNGTIERPERTYYESTDPLHEDTLKTYCTEGTPYETPYNFSTATSMSDLHVEPPTPHEEDIKEEDEVGGDSVVEEEGAVGKRKEEIEQVDTEKAAIEAEEKKGKEENDNFSNGCLDKEPQMKSLPPTAPRPPVKGLQSGLSSGLMSPEKPVQYCEEGTPGCFSRVSSLSSLHSGVGISTESQDHSGPCSPPSQLPGPGQSPEQPPNNKNIASEGAEELKEEPRTDREAGKVVTFGGADHYAEETPLMFSRCSSLGSLSSFEQHSIHDDRSSVVSDFSRRTSGIVSPSELPDSPTQTVPPSPRHQSKQSGPPVEFTSRLSGDSGAVRSTPLAPRHQAGSSSGMKASVFEDDVATFKEESTPVEFSRTTSLSSLTIDDEPKICNDAVLKEGVLKPQARPAAVVVAHRSGPVAGCSSSSTEDGMEKQDMEKEKRELADCCELAPVSEGEEENDEDMLAACISIGMQNSRQRQSQQSSSGIKVPLRGQSIARHYPHSGPLNRGGRPSGIPIKTPSNNMPRLHRINRQPEPTRTSTKSMTFVEVPGGGVCEDALRTYHTEGTPANISHAGSHSDLSVLSLPGDDHETEVSNGSLIKAPPSQEKAGREEAGAAPGEKEEGEVELCDQEERPELSDDSSNFSGDGDNILAECIQSGMPKARPQSTRRILPQPGCIAKPVLTVQDKVVAAVSATQSHPVRRPVSVQPPRSHHLCGLDHGPPRQPMPARRPAVGRPRASPPQRLVPEHGKAPGSQVVLPQCTGARDELETSLLSRPVSEGTSCDTPLRFATEDTPLEVSHAASLSSLSICEDDEDFQGEHARPASGASSTHSPVPHVLNTSEQTSEGDTLEAPPCPHLMMASDGSWGDRSDRHEDSTTSSRPLNKNSSASEEMVTVLSRNGSLSSLSVDSFGSTEPTPSEQALLEQCISSGMPKSKSEVSGSKGSRIAVPVLKKKVGMSCKLPLSSLASSECHKLAEEDHIPSLPMPKLELRPNSRHNRETSSLESDMMNLSLQDEACCSSSSGGGGGDGNLPKNGLESSAAVSATKDTVVDANGSNTAIVNTSIISTTVTTRVITNAVGENDLLGIHLTTEMKSERSSPAHVPTNPPHTTESYSLGSNCEDLLVVNTLTLEDGKKVLEIDLKEDTRPDYIRQTSSSLYESATMTVKEELYKRQPSIFDDSPKVKRLVPKGEILSPESNTNDSKSPLSSGESPSSDFISEGDSSKKKQVGDAMITSLDRMTADLVNGLKEKDGEAPVMKQSLVGSDTWNEDASPNDVSFPSLSISAPMVASFKSDKDDMAALPELVEEDVSGPGPQEASMTDSHLIELEAERVAGAVKAEVEDMDQSVNSLNSMDLDNIKPPSMMGSLLSLTTSLSGHLENDSFDSKDRCHSASTTPQPRPTCGVQNRSEGKPSRKKSLPIGMMVRRALGNNHNSSMENLLDNNNVCSSSSCNSHIDNIKPPSAMEEVMDLVDMENSMVSVASITSEVADSSGKDQSNSEPSPANSDALFDLLKPAANAMAEVYAAHIASQTISVSVRTSSASDNLDNVNPPSLLNEMGDFTDQESLIEPGTETICSDTELITEDPAHTYPINSPETSLKNTPVESDQYGTSSAESTPKKGKSKQLTPKQKRQLVKDRYRTYTIAAEQEKKAAKLQMQQEMNSHQVLENTTENDETVSVNHVSEVDALKDSPKSNKITPKQRRQEDRSRFQTQVLDKPLTLDIKPVIPPEPESSSEIAEDNLKTPKVDQDDVLSQASAASELPGIKKSKSMKTVKQKRTEAKDRYRTRTLSEDITTFVHRNTNGEDCVASSNLGVGFGVPSDITPEELETLLEHDANIVINSLNERIHSESSDGQSSDDMFIDCETLSLVSIESESEQNSNTPLRGPNHVVKKCFGDFETLAGADNDKVQNVEDAREETRACDSESDSESSSSCEVEEARGSGRPRIVKPGVNEIRSRDGSVDSTAPEEAPNSSPKPIRGRRKALYSSPASRKPPVQPSVLKTSRPQSSIPQVGKSASFRPTRASNLRQAGRGGMTSSPSPRSLSQTPSGGPSPASTSPKTTKGPTATNKTQQPRSSGIKTPSPVSKATGSRNSIGSASTTRSPKVPNQKLTNTSSNSNNGEKVTNQPNETDPKFRPPERQGTFTKDEPTVANVANATIPPPLPSKTRIPLPSEKTTGLKVDPKKKQIPKLISPAKQKFHKENQSIPSAKPSTTRKVNEEKVASLAPKGLQKANTMPERRTGITRLPTASRLPNRRSIAGGEMKTSLSNQSLQSNDSTKGSIAQSMNQRSSSNCSLSSVTSVGTVATVTTKKTQAKKEVTSKIASLWKKVEESKKQQNLKKDTRVWITGKPATDEDTNNTTLPSETPQTVEIEGVEA
ncbi:Uncharacterized protein GBIM_18977 [Gryllus bimaculatus]|nr:Uncharacterized protein GBIM_18977 [Gryllus bimaculatus]